MTLNQFTRRIRNQILRIRQACQFQSSINTRGVCAIKKYDVYAALASLQIAAYAN